MYLQLERPPNKSRTAYIIFYALCVLYVLSTVNVVIDLVVRTLKTSNMSICKYITQALLKLSCERQPEEIVAVFRMNLLQLAQGTVIGLCDFFAQCILVRINHCIYHSFYSPKFSKIYRCWIVWGQTIRVVIVPSFLAITFLGQSINSHFLKQTSIYRRASSYLANRKFRRNNWTRPIARRFLGNPVSYSKFHPVHSCEYPGDGLDRVQDPQGVLGS
jgi:hypothetical protein